MRKPIDLKGGTRLSVEAVYDNSDRNPSNPFNPPRAVFFGEQTDNEMCFVFLGATSDTPGRIKAHFGGTRRPEAKKAAAARP